MTTIAHFDIGSDHAYECRCDFCLEWWTELGPDGFEPGNYGPFTKEEVNARQRELGLAETD